MLRYLLAIFPLVAFSQNILHFTETSGFDHNTRGVSLSMFQDIASLDGYTVVDDQDGSEFNSLVNLVQYDVIIFSNTSGDAILDPAQRSNFEAYVNMGGRVLGIHAASDTYRHSTANGGNTGTWDFYPEMLGASVQQNPNHVSGTPLYAMGHVGLHQSTANLPDPWNKNEEYYYWSNGFFDSSNVEVLQVEETLGPNGQVNPYDAARAMSWYRLLPSGAKVFYTALGHAQSNFTSDTLFQQHMRDALAWLMPTNVGVEAHDAGLQARQEGQHLFMAWDANWGSSAALYLYASDGSLVDSWKNKAPGFVNLNYLPAGTYVLKARFDRKRVSTSFFWSP